MCNADSRTIVYYFHERNSIKLLKCKMQNAIILLGCSIVWRICVLRDGRGGVVIGFLTRNRRVASSNLTLGTA